ncbi:MULTISPECIES: transferrin-binding protein-like solute binding protein [unclassified Neisseria]|uniref:transferrin-binding protein-like solute binding protein n=1 Tax=unclassified Neisseria TaxID=2623750 RepID=UPI001071D4CE|nr:MULTISPECIES: transferrin-binding protein-like solute binding protein [unclassified Neisseria]MBF0803190.1 transferrin-binding protein-like solute binding protein [Neisseria sp. 19428wB4_WF04]TFU44164.1 hypothetical protein E4T99_02260 [Neisseria sp. WF04]
MMSKKYINLPALAVFSALALAACGGGGGGSPDTGSTPTPPSAANPGAGSPGVGQNTVGGVQYISGATTNDLKKLVVNGQTIDLFPAFPNSSITIGPAGIFNYNGEITGGSALTRFGNRTINGQTVVFAQGTELTANMPQSGTATYDGRAVYGMNGKYTTATSKALVDFAAKKIDVTLSGIEKHEAFTAPASLKFGGSISGNTFSGTQNGVETKGAFYGNNAAYVTGTFRNTADNANGAFGGAR